MKLRLKEMCRLQKVFHREIVLKTRILEHMLEDYIKKDKWYIPTEYVLRLGIYQEII